VRQDAFGAVKWIEGEVEAFDEVLSSCGDYCACIGTHNDVSLLETVVCEHVKGCYPIEAYNLTL
jgi:hypothetical protein